MEAVATIVALLGVGAIASSVMSGPPEDQEIQMRPVPYTGPGRQGPNGDVALRDSARREAELVDAARREAERVDAAKRAGNNPPEPAKVPGPVADLLRSVSVPVDRDWNDPGAFRAAVAEQRERLFPPGTYVRDEVVFEACKNAFASFARKFGHILFAFTDESSAHYSNIKLTTTPAPQAPEDQTIGTNFGALAERYMYLRRQVSAPRVAHNDKGLGYNTLRYKRWKHGWEQGWGYKELTIAQRFWRNPAIPFTNNWPVFLHLSVQYSMMEMLYSVFWSVTRDFVRNPGSWNTPGSNVVEAVEQHIASIEGSHKIATKTRDELIVDATVASIAQILSKISKPFNVLGLVPSIGKRIGAVMHANGNVKIDNQLISQLNDAWTDAERKERMGGPSATMRFVFDDIAAFAAARQVATDGGTLPEPAYLLGGAPIKTPRL